MQSSHRWIWQHPHWPPFTWDQAALTEPLARARLAQGKVLGAARLLECSSIVQPISKVL
ncbi:DUF4172 domain-containing protein [Vogesella indigofera]|uniref:DUF4172 domain-containing protein n=1 Tax=Vogesella indigofera TaxID=45465 RepID=UPI000EB48393